MINLDQTEMSVNKYISETMQQACVLKVVFLLSHYRINQNYFIVNLFFTQQGDEHQSRMKIFKIRKRKEKRFFFFKQEKRHATYYI